jgi:pyridoxamine 5'-phosphate oxidase
MDYSDLRKEYLNRSLSARHLKKDPFEQLFIWLEEAVQLGELEPNAMILCTANKIGQPSSRTVLLKEIDERGLLFYTNLKSRKATDLEENPKASITFLWKKCARQVSVDGRIELLPRAKVLSYFSKRPRESQIASWASQQGERITSRKELLKKYRDYEKKWKGHSIPLPSFFGGYRLIPHCFTFWQGNAFRLHDRFLYTLGIKKAWEMTRIAP